MMKKIIFGILFLFNCFLQAQPQIEWQKSFGSTNKDEGYSIAQTSDDGYITAGTTLSNSGNAAGHIGNYDCVVIKTDNSGIMQWQKTFGGSSDDAVSSIKQTVDGGYIFAGYTLSNNGEVSGNHGNFDFWIVKLSSTGDIEWQKCLGGSNDDRAYSIDKTNDGNYIVAGYAHSNDGDVTGIKGYSNAYELGPNYWIVKISPKGGIIWEKSYGGYSDDIAESIHQTPDGGYIVSGSSHANTSTMTGNLDATGNHGGYDYWVVKLDSLGDLVWQKCLGGSAHDYGGPNIPTSDGGCVVSGSSISNDGDVTGNHGGFDYWVVKLSSLGKVQWQKCFGGSGSEDGSQYDLNTSLEQTADGDYILAGWSASNNGDTSGNHGSYDYWIVKFDRGGQIQWQKCLGGNSVEKANAIKPTADGGYIITGWSSSNNGDVSVNNGNRDFWVVKLSNPLGLNDFTTENALAVYPNPAKNQINISLQNSSENLNTLVIYDVLGNCVKRANTLSTNQSSIDTSVLAKGIYLIEIATESQLKLTKKLIIE